MKLCLIVLACLVGVLAAAPTEKETKTPIVHFADGEQHIPVEVKNLNEADVRAEANALKPKKREINAADAPQAAEKKPDEVKKPEEKTESDVKAAPAEEKKSSESSEQKPAAAPVPASDEKKSDATPAEPEKAGESKTEENISGEKPAEPEKAAETKSAPAEEKKTDTNDPAESKSEEVKADPPKVAAKSEEQKKPEATVDVAVKPEKIAENKPVAAAEESKPEAKSEKEVAKADAAIPAPEEKPSVSEQIPAESKIEEAKAVPAQAKVESLEQVKSESEPDVVTETENAAESTATPAADESKSEPAAESKPAATVAESKPEAESDEPAESVEGDAQEKEPSEVQVQGRSARVDIEAAPAKKTRSGKKYSDFQIIKLESEMEENGKYHYQFESDDGISANQDGELKKIDEENSGESVKGGYSYTDEDGRIISLTYTADENGFRPVGDHLPTPPPIPVAIARAIEWAATAKPWVDPWVVEQEKLREARKGKQAAKRSVRRA